MEPTGGKEGADMWRISQVGPGPVKYDTGPCMPGEGACRNARGSGAGYPAPAAQYLGVGLR
jgi:hypothetical protein